MVRTWDPWIVRQTRNPGNTCISGLPDPLALAGRLRLGREPQPFACRRSCPGPPAPPAKQAWLKHPWRNSPATQEANRPPLLTGPVLRIRDPRSDHRPGLFLPPFWQLLVPVSRREAAVPATAPAASQQLHFPSLFTTQRDTWNRTHSQPSSLPCCSAVSSSCVRPLQVLDPGNPIGQHHQPQLATSPFPPMVGFTIPPPGLCQASDVDVLQLRPHLAHLG